MVDLHARLIISHQVALLDEFEWLLKSQPLFFLFFVVIFHLIMHTDICAHCVHALPQSASMYVVSQSGYSVTIEGQAQKHKHEASINSKFSLHLLRPNHSRSLDHRSGNCYVAVSLSMDAGNGRHEATA
jgi:hypothetical protein